MVGAGTTCLAAIGSSVEVDPKGLDDHSRSPHALTTALMGTMAEEALIVRALAVLGAATRNA